MLNFYKILYGILQVYAYTILCKSNADIIQKILL